MSKKKIMLVFGTRPEAIKMAPIVNKLREESKYFEVIVCVTGQHRQMLDQVLDIFCITPNIDLNIMKPGQNLFDVTASIIITMRDVFLEHQPDIVLLHGDTTTTLATSIAAFYSGIPIGHVEAGLRTHNLKAPFPEEFNRQVTSKVSHWHFAPTDQSRQNLINEGVDESKIFVTGNTVIDALHSVLLSINDDQYKRKKIEKILDQTLNFDWQAKVFILITGHRRENFGEGFLEICAAIKKLANKFTDVFFVYPVHLNPNVGEPINHLLAKLDNVFLIEPLEYESFVYLLKHSYLVLTDSGGIQEEAPSLGKPVLVMRDISERPEAVAAGTVELVGANQKKIVSVVSKLLKNESFYLRMSHTHNPYGDGNSSTRIIDILKNV